MEHPASKPNSNAAIDLAALRERVEDDLELLEELIDLFLETSPRLVSEVEAAIADRDSQQLERSAHSLKGSLQNLSAARCAETAMNLEKLGRSKTFASADDIVAQLKSQLQELRTELDDVKARLLAK